MNEKPHIMRLWQLLQQPEFRDVVDDDGRVVRPSSEIFFRLSTHLESDYKNMSPKNIYTILKMNRYEMHDKVLIAHNIAKPNVSVISDCANSTRDYSLADSIEFMIDVTHVWTKIQPDSVEYKFTSGQKREIYMMRRFTWTSAIFEKVQVETKLPCALVFKNAKISQSGIYVTVLGKCPECSCTFLGKIINEPQSGDVVKMECLMEGFDPSIKHAKKRQLKGLERVAVSKQLVEGNTLACEWRRNEANRLISRIGDEEPAHLYKGRVLRKAKQERQDKLLAVESTDVYASLHLMKYSSKYEGAIKRVGLDPLFVYYWTKEQEAVYYNYHNTVYIDATGSLIKKIKLPNGDLCPHVYLYQIVAQVDKKTVPVCQMISAAQSTNDILVWLKIFCQQVSAQVSASMIPKETVTDFDKALLGAVAQAFAKQPSLRHYLDVCFRLLTHPFDIRNVPPCLLRLDVCHFSNMIARWKCFTDKPNGVRNFYLRAVAILRKQEDFDEFTQIAKSIFILALNANGEAGGLAEHSRLYLSSYIRGDPLPGMGDEDLAKTIDQDGSDEPILNSNYLERSDSYGWVGNMYRECTELINNEAKSDDINGYYCLAFAKKLKALLPYFPLFSEVMRGVFKYGSPNATSAAVESEFNDLKNRTFRTVSLPLRADKFVGKHILSFSGKIKLALAGKNTANIYEDACERVDEASSSVPSDIFELRNDESIEITQSAIHDIPAVTIKNQQMNYDTIAELKGVDESPTPVPLDTFEQQRNESIEETRFIQNIPAPTFKDRQVDDNTIDELEEMKAEHNWRNKNDKKTKRFRYADPCPIFTTSSSGFVSLPIIPNGHNCPNVRDNNVTICLRNTCGFDSICQIIASLACNDVAHKRIVTEGSSPIFTCVNIFIDEGLSARFFKRRANILINIKELKPEQCRRNIVKLNASSNIGNLTRYLLEDKDPSCMVTTRCLVCGAETARPEGFINVNHDVLLNEGMGQLLKAIEDGRHLPKRCCNQLPITELQYGSLLFIETDYGNRTVALADFPDKLLLSRGRQYILAGVIGYVGSYNFKSVGHYTSYIRSGQQWLFCDNSPKKPKPRWVNNDQQIAAPMCVYVIT